MQNPSVELKQSIAMGPLKLMIPIWRRGWPSPPGAFEMTLHLPRTYFILSFFSIASTDPRSQFQDVEEDRPRNRRTSFIPSFLPSCMWDGHRFQPYDWHPSFAPTLWLTYTSKFRKEIPPHCFVWVPCFGWHTHWLLLLDCCLQQWLFSSESGNDDITMAGWMTWLYFCVCASGQHHMMSLQRVWAMITRQSTQVLGFRQRILFNPEPWFSFMLTWIAQMKTA